MLMCSLYIASVVLANWAFSVLPIWHGVPAATAIVGIVFVTRDLAQRQVGHRVILAMIIALSLSFLLAKPLVAVASAAAFAVSETTDWGVYSIMNRPLRDRILVSSAIGTPLDSIVFLALLPFPGALTVQAVVLMTAVKMLAAIAIWGWLGALPVRRHA